ncbi:hypothetical protein [Halorientalis halophila]|uniref:hypothetical protein n=1 Tax=Halorientalis halophila TaxID=3108499 RepID=UPI00300A0C11
MTGANQEAVTESADRPETAEFVCPECSGVLDPEGYRCRNCGVVGIDLDGVVSFRETETGSAGTGIAADELPEGARLPTPDADSIGTALEGEPDRTDRRSVVTDVRRDLWRVLAAEHLTGRCLNLYTEFGRRSLCLAELVDVVYAVDPRLSRLRVAADREDYESTERVVPVHATRDRLPFAAGTFDTIVADFSGRTDVREGVEQLREYLAPGGSLLCIADGWPRKLAATSAAELGRDAAARRRPLSPGTANGYRRLGRSVGFDHVAAYALLPSSERPLYAFPVENDRAVRTIGEFALAERGRYADAFAPIVSRLAGSRLTKQCFPSYLVVYADEHRDSSFAFTDPLVVAGRTRSIVLDVGADGIESVVKVPNRRAHAPFTARENEHLERLRSSGAPITETLPEGRQIASRFGPARAERPASGRELGAELTGDPESFGRVLSIGLDWLAAFQQSFRGESETRSPAEIREDLRFEPTGLEPPTVEAPLETFTTPVHGDFLAANIHAHDDAVTTVIDWEYVAPAASPVVDAGYVLIDTAYRTIGDLEEGLRTVLCDRNEFADRAREAVRTYCDAVDLPVETFERYLHAVYVHQLELDRRFGAAKTHPDRMADLTRRARIVRDVATESALF